MITRLLCYLLLFLHAFGTATAETLLPVRIAPLSQRVVQTGNGQSSTPVFSPDGSRIIFVSSATDLTTNTYPRRGLRNLFFYDVASNTISMVSRSETGVAGNGASTFRSFSEDGRYLLFETLADNLFPADTNRHPDTLRIDLFTGERAVISSSGHGTRNALLSGDGSLAIYELLARGPNGSPSNNLYSIHFDSGETRLVSTNKAGSEGYRYVWSSALSDNVPVALFSLVSPPNSFFDPFSPDNVFSLSRVDLVSGESQVISSNLASRYPGGLSFRSLCVSSNGQFMAYRARGVSSNVVVWRDVVAGVDHLITEPRNNGGLLLGENSGPFLSHDGQSLVLETENKVRTWRASDGLLKSASATNDVTVLPLISPDGQWISYVNVSSNAVVIQTLANGVPGEVHYLTSIIGRASEVSEYAIHWPTRQIAWSTRDMIGTAEANGAGDIFVSSLDSNTTRLVSRRLPGPMQEAGITSVSDRSLSADGRFVCFTSQSDYLVANDTNGFRDVFVRDLETDALTLVSSSIGGGSGNGNSVDARITPDGRYVAFSSHASNLVMNDTNRFSDVFVRDLLTGSTRLISQHVSGFSPGWESFGPRISADGQVVAFTSRGTNFTDGVGRATSRVFVREFAENTPQPTLVTNSSVDFRLVDMSADAKFVVQQSPSGIVSWLDRNSGEVQLLVGHSQPVLAASGSHLVTVTNIQPEVRDLVTGLVTGISGIASSMAVPANGSSGVVQTVLRSNPDNVLSLSLWNFAQNTKRVIASEFTMLAGSQPGYSLRPNYPATSWDGQWIAYHHSYVLRYVSTILTNSDRYNHLLLYDVGTSNTTSITTRWFDGSISNLVVGKPRIQGNYLTFLSSSDDLLENDKSGGVDAFLITLPPPANLDADDDGMADLWEITNLGTTNALAADDLDNDGRTNLDEFMAGTLPNSRNSAFVDCDIEPTTNGIFVTWKAVFGRSYLVEFKENIEGATWMPLNRPISLQGEKLRVQDIDASAPRRFYRVGMLVP